MKAKILVYALPVLILTTIHVAEAQQPTKIPRIGYLSGTSSSFSSARVDALRQGLNELGYFEGKYIVIEYRFADGKPDRLPALAKEFVGLKLDVVVATTTASVLAVKKASATIPIVVVSSADPIASGLVASLARPGGNITGLTILAPELSGKRLELLKEVLPNVTRIGVLRNPANPAQEPIWKEIQAAAQQLRLQLQSLEVRSSNDLDSAFEAALRERSQALITSPEPLINAHMKRIVDFATKKRLACDVCWSRGCGRWRFDVLRAELCRPLPPRWLLCGEDSEGCKAG